MYRICAISVVLVGAGLTSAGDEPKKKLLPGNAPTAESEELSVADQIMAVATDSRTKQRDIVKRYREAKDDAERQKVLEEYNKLDSEILAKYAQIVEKHPEDEAVIPALYTLIGKPDYSALAATVLVKHHLDNKQIGGLCLQLGQFLSVKDDADAEKLLHTAAEKSKSHEVKGLAMLGLGQLLSERSNRKDIDETQRERLRKEAKETLAFVVSTYANVDTHRGGTAGDRASGMLFELEHLAIGLPVPDLKGEDLEGAKFKLSDYRGKVVFLDFWAHW